MGAAFAFDLCLDDKASNRELFDKAAKKLVQAAMSGSNVSILAYGQTSSGKTHSVLGTPFEPGLLPLSVEEIFENDGIQRRVCPAKLSYFEIFNEKVIDLLCPQTAASATPSLPVKEDAGRGFFVHGLREAPVRSSEDVLRLVARGEERRRYARTRWNDYSSRSHVLFTLSFEEASPEAAGVRACTKLNIVDLAGCENHKHEASEDGRHINRSLFFLGEVISRLCKDGRRPREGGHRRSPSGPADLRKDAGPSTPRHGGHATQGEGRSLPGPRSRERSTDFIPYRDSKLTRVLRSSLGGDALTMLLVTVHPAVTFSEQSLTSLRFAAKARCVENCIPSYAEAARYDEEKPSLGARLVEGFSERQRVLSNSGMPPGVTEAAAQRGRRAQDGRSGEPPVQLQKELRQLRAELAEKERELATKARLLSERDRQLGQLREQLDMATRVKVDGFQRARHGADTSGGLPGQSVDPWSPFGSSDGLSFAGGYGKDEDRSSEGSQGRLSAASRAEDIPCLRHSSFVTRQQNLVAEEVEGTYTRGGETQEELVEKLVKLAVMQINTISKADVGDPPSPPRPDYGWQEVREEPEDKVPPSLLLPGLPVPSNPDVQGTPRKSCNEEDVESPLGLVVSSPPREEMVPLLPGQRG